MGSKQTLWPSVLLPVCVVKCHVVCLRQLTGSHSIGSGKKNKHADIIFDLIVQSFHFLGDIFGGLNVYEVTEALELIQ